MKKILFLVVCCFCLCGCGKSWKNKIEIIDTVYSSTGIQLKVKAKENKKYDNICIKVKLIQEKTKEEETLEECHNIDYGETVTFFFDSNIKDIYQGLDYNILNVSF